MFFVFCNKKFHSETISLTDSFLLFSKTTSNHRYDSQLTCPQCGKSYQYRRNLQSHLKYECGKLPIYQCPICPYSAKLKGNLRKHMNIRHY